MELHSLLYLLFLLPAVCVTALLRVPGRRLVFFLALSYFFYWTWSPGFIFLLWGSSLLNFLIGRRLRRRRRGWLLATAIGANLLLLVAARNAAALLGGWLEPTLASGLLLPVGVSFYTFQALSFQIDLYRGLLEEEPTLLEFLVFMSFWPVVLAGPICRLPEMLPQFRNAVQTWRGAWEGMRRIVVGLFMKVVLAGVVAHGLFEQGGVDRGFDGVETWNSLDVICLSFGYGLQLFFDFAGYSHIAIGSALLVGIRLRENFKAPFAATSPGDFWGRWHRSLSSWIRDYVFFPLATRHRSFSWRLGAVVVSMVTFGAWHGLTASFLVWGLFHGLILAGQRILGARSPGWPPVLGWALTSVLINLGWILFRSGSLAQAASMYAALFSPGRAGSVTPAFSLLVAVLLGASLLVHFGHSRLLEGWRTPRTRQVQQLVAPAFFVALFLFTLAWGEAESPFVYVQF